MDSDKNENEKPVDDNMENIKKEIKNEIEDNDDILKNIKKEEVKTEVENDDDVVKNIKKEEMKVEVEDQDDVLKNIKKEEIKVEVEAEDNVVKNIEKEEMKDEVEDEDDVVLTLSEVIAEMDRREDNEDCLLGAENSNVCSYPEGYKPRQVVYACNTCTPAPLRAGICYGCSINCHPDHDIIELYTKRKFKCDCGNSVFGDKTCKLYEEKDRTNKYNTYDHNYNGTFCTCDDTYPTPATEEEMRQCEICEDWFHPSHIGMPEGLKGVLPEPSKETGAIDETCASSLICKKCVTDVPFIRHLKDATEVICHSKLSNEKVEAESGVLIENFRSKLCKCYDCKNVYDRYNCDYLLDDEDDLTKFEEESRKQAAEKRPSEDDDTRALVSNYGMEGAIAVAGIVNQFKRKVGEFLTAAQREGKVVKVEDVHNFFDELKGGSKRRRMNDDGEHDDTDEEEGMEENE